MKFLAPLLLLLIGCLPTATAEPTLEQRVEDHETRIAVLEGKDGDPNLDGLAELTRQGWRDYTESQAQVLIGIAAEIRSGNIKTKAEWLDALNKRGSEARNKAMEQVSRTYFNTPIGEQAAQAMEESAKGLQWHLTR